MGNRLESRVDLEAVADRLPRGRIDEDLPEAIYQALYVRGGGALKRELVTCLRAGRALRLLRARAQQRARGHVTDAVMIRERPPEADDRSVPGHWEGDSIIGTE